MNIAVEVGNTLRKRKMTLAVAESCTGGLISNLITDVSGSSEYFKMGVVAYSNKIKENVLWIPGSLIRKHGAVSRQVALEMAEGARAISSADVGVGITGIAGPTGGTKSKPVGLVYISLVTPRKRIVKEYNFKGSRQYIKLQASEAALEFIMNVIASEPLGERSNLNKIASSA
jgi:nicotinamide-nucleotide amidase